MSGIISDNVGRASGVIAAAGGGGKVLQVVQDVLTSKWDVSSTSFTAVTGLAVTIRPASGTKILVLGTLTGSAGAATNGGGACVKRDSTFIQVGDDAHSRSRGLGNSYRINHANETKQTTICYLDTHGADGSTDVVYTWQVFSESPSTFYVNSDVDPTGAYSYYGNYASSIIAIELSPND